MATGSSSIDRLEQRLLELESMVSRIRAEQLTVIAELDRAQVCAVDGARTLGEWVTGRLDVAPETGRSLAFAARSESQILADELAAGDVSLDRVVATRRLANTGAGETALAASAGVAVQHVRRLTSRHEGLAPADESTMFQTRRLFAQPDLSNTAWNVRGRLPAVDGEIVFKALEDRADALVPQNDSHRPTLPQRRADALVAWAMDHLDPAGATGTSPRTSIRLAATMHIDRAAFAGSGGMAGVTTLHGLKAGPNTVDEASCAGTVTGCVVDGATVKTVNVKQATIPKAVRDYVWHRDGGCTADGCTSIYRLEPHHVEHRADDGDHHPDNLTLLCWYHHHVVVHQQGFIIDPESGPGRRRFLRPPPDRDPPLR